jgi:hypothetical protein
VSSYQDESDASCEVVRLTGECMRGSGGMTQHTSVLRNIALRVLRESGLGAVLLLAFPGSAHGLPRRGVVEFQASPGSFCVAGPDRVAPVYVDENDFPGVRRAVNDLVQDIARVSDQKAPIVDSTEKLPLPPILIGTLGKSAVIDALVASGKLDVTAIRGQWESYVIQTVENPMAGVKQALVIAGSDRRGTIYGIYDVSEDMGVSPWYWWADVPTPHHEAIYIHAGRIVQGPPAVKYRGIFINDEAPAMSGWTQEKFGGFNSKMYGHMFELLLRLRANYLWPAMWGAAFNEDDPENPRLADEYGIVMGTSHQEPMMRSQNEFDHRYQSDQWDYIQHPELMEDFWREGVRRNRNDENLYTMGLRGRNDSMMLPNGSTEENIALLDKIIARQQKILTEEVNPDIDKIPQVWTLYKEVQDFYDRGMKVPDNITLLWSDDNFGDLRRAPTAEERKRAGGAGIYYHFDYHGGPRSYQWLNTNPLPKVQEQMEIAYQYGARQIWIVNVGDLKPMELPTEFFLTMAWDPEAMTKDKVADFTQQWADREFGTALGPRVADVVASYAKYNGWRRPESLSPGTFSLTNYDEAERVEAAWTKLASEAEAIGNELPADMQAEACANLTELYIAAARNALYAAQGRVSTNAEARRVRELFAHDQGLSDEYNHLLGGRWNHMMDQTHIGYTSWAPPKTNVMPPVKEITPKAGAWFGVAVEGSEQAWPGSDARAALPAIDTVGDQHRWIDVFSRGTEIVHFTATAQERWIKIDTATGDTGSDRRLRVRVDWKAAPVGKQSGTIMIAGDNGEKVSIALPVVNVPGVARAAQGAFGNLTEAFTVPASAATKNVPANSVAWQPMPDYGRVGSAMEVFPVTASPVKPPKQSPYLEYPIYLSQTGEIEVNAVIGSTLEILPGRGLHLAVSIDDDTPQAIDGGEKVSLSNPTFDKMVLDNVHTLTFHQNVAQPGRHVLKVWMVDPDVVLEYLVVGAAKPSYFGPPAPGVGPPVLDGVRTTR